MNLNFCRYKCGKSFHPSEIFVLSNGKFILSMSDSTMNGECQYCIYIEDAWNLIESPPKGWFRGSANSIKFEYGNAEDVLWGIRMTPDSECPYFTEHTMYDIGHDRRLAEWREHEELRKKIIEERKKNAKTDGSELP